MAPLYGLKQESMASETQEVMLSNVSKINGVDFYIFSKFKRNHGTLLCLYVDMPIFATYIENVKEIKKLRDF